MNQHLTLLQIEHVSVKANGIALLDDIHLSIREHEQWAIIGPSGSGKTTLAHALTGKIFHGGQVNFHLPQSTSNRSAVVMVEQQHNFRNLSNTTDFYYQQRFNASDAENSITVREALREYAGNEAGMADTEKYIQLLRLRALLDEPLIQLSNGENKRLQLAEALLSSPAFLILDNPFTGLDAEGRKTLHRVLDAICASGIHLIIVTTSYELPECITHVALLEKGKLISTSAKSDFRPFPPKPPQPAFDVKVISEMAATFNDHFAVAVRMKNVSIVYGEKVILDKINWEVKKGERWSITGPNGAGKSTLLSLITADNPQAYANEIYLFDQRRGRGESIWDIKKRIGYISPELHLYFERTTSCFGVIASGLFDTIGLFRQLSAGQEQLVERWMGLLQLQNLRDKTLMQLSIGQQRMVLLARALVKNPPMLILDEPCQGLDEEQTVYFNQLIDRLCERFNTTLLYVSHYEKDMPASIDHFLKLKSGRRVN